MSRILFLHGVGRMRALAKGLGMTSTAPFPDGP